MCGIIGQFDFNDRLPGEGEKIVPALMRLMTRRGPDDEGMWTDGKICTLGACRLAISDLSPAGHQPMQTQDGRYVLTYNGEVYNFKQLRQELEQKGELKNMNTQLIVLIVDQGGPFKVSLDKS
jgi:asparagine synthase (glutamine-hydrolysing)